MQLHCNPSNEDLEMSNDHEKDIYGSEEKVSTTSLSNTYS